MLACGPVEQADSLERTTLLGKEEEAAGEEQPSARGTDSRTEGPGSAGAEWGCRLRAALTVGLRESELTQRTWHT